MWVGLSRDLFLCIIPLIMRMKQVMFLVEIIIPFKHRSNEGMWLKYHVEYPSDLFLNDVVLTC